MRSMRWFGVGIVAWVGGCGATQQPPHERPPRTPPTVPVASASPSVGASAPLPVPSAPPTSKANMTVSLQGEDPIVVPGSGLTAHISEAFHKTRAPLVGVSVLFTTTEAPIRRAQVAWRIESGNIDASWHPLEGRRYDTETSKYVEESIPGWKVRLDSIDDQNAGGTPTAITITLTRSPDATQ